MSDENIKKDEEKIEELEELKKKFEMCAKERDEYLNGWRRSKADYVNYKNEEMKRLEEVIKFGNTDLIKECLDVLSNLDVALAAMSGSKEEEGIRLIRSQLEEMLKRRGLEKVPVEVGKPWNPMFHEVVEQVENGSPPDSIVSEVRGGYMVHGKVLKTAKVKVAK